MDNSIDMAPNIAADRPNVPDTFTSLPPVQDLLHTQTSSLQEETIRECLPFLAGSVGSLFDYNEYGVPALAREEHIRFLHDSLNTLPAAFVAYDAARPWIIYWALTGLYLLGEDITRYREKVVQTFASIQNVDGGFGGGHGQISHCAPSYAAILSLAIVGGTKSLDLIDRLAMWKWLGKIKQSNGGFRVCIEGEEDVRGAYCSMVMISLLKLPLELPQDSPARIAGLTSFLDGLPQYLSRCQTFEGGISGCPQTEAHGAYAFCVLACLSILGPPQEMIPRYLKLPLLISWLSARQYAPEGGFSGRTNKLVDGCYSHWVGGCWPLIEAALNGPRSKESRQNLTTGSLFSRNGLIRYILCCCQSKNGGLRDKPSKHPDAYHSCYVLAGLSAAQHFSYYAATKSSTELSSLDSAFQWKISKDPIYPDNATEPDIFDVSDRLLPIHPIYVIPLEAVERLRAWVRSRHDLI